MGTGQFINTFMPYQTPPIAFGGMYNFAPFATKRESEKEAEERRIKEERKKAADEFNKRMELIKQRAEMAPKLAAQIKEIEEGKKELENQLNLAKNGKENEDGIIIAKESWEDYKKLPAWKKGLRGASHLVQGTWKLATGFFGYETNPKTGESEWNWKKGLKNAAIAAGCIALTAVPVIGPVISTGLLATGVVCGTIGTVNGVRKAINAVNAESPQELDQAFQDMGSGLTIGISSAIGLRGLGKGLQTSAATGTVRATGSNAVSQFIKDTTINAYRATVQGVKTQSTAVASNGFIKTYGTNLKGMIPKLGKSKFENARYDTTQKINSRLNDISRELNNPDISPIQKSLLEQEQTVLNAQKTELANTVTKGAWKSLKTDSKVHDDISAIKNSIKELQSTGSTNVNGQTYNMNEENLTALQEALSRSQKMSKEIQNLVKVRTSTMKKMASLKKYKNEVEAYTGKTRNSRLGRYYDAAKISKSDITWKNALLSPFKFLWEVTMIPFKPWNYVQNTSTSTFYKIEETFVPTYEEGFLTSGILGSALEMGDKAMTTKIFSKDENGNDTEEVVPVTKEVITQMEEQLQQYNDAIAKAQSELNHLYEI